MRLTREQALRSRNFYRNLYRAFVKWLWFSLACNVVLTFLLFYLILRLPEPRYYATNSAGAGFINKLRPMVKPNLRKGPLLKPDPPEEMRVKKVDFIF